MSILKQVNPVFKTSMIEFTVANMFVGERLKSQVVVLKEFLSEFYQAEIKIDIVEEQRKENNVTDDLKSQKVNKKDLENKHPIEKFIIEKFNADEIIQ